MSARILKIYYALSAAVFLSNSMYAAIFGVFMKHRGMEDWQIAALNLVFLSGSLLFEIPTGIMADYFGRKKSFILSCIVSAFSMCIYTISDNFYLFALADLSAALACALSSGAFEAWAVDSMIHAEGGCDAGWLAGRVLLFQTGARVAGSIAGSYLVAEGMIYPFLAASGIMLATTVAGALFMKESYRAPKHPSSIKSLDLYYMLREGMANCSKARILKYVVLACFALAVAEQSVNTFWTIELSIRGLEISKLGPVYAVFVILTAFSTMIYRRLRRTAGKTEAIWILPIVMFCAGLIGMGATSGLFSFFLCFIIQDCGRAVNALFSSRIINEHSTSMNRATLLSFNAAAANAGGILGLTVAGIALESHAITSVWLLFGVLSAAIIIPVAYRFLIDEKNPFYAIEAK